MPAPSPTRALLEVRDLTVRYGGTGNPRPVVCGLNFEISAGEVVGIQGRSGCGKTSAALALLRLLPPDAGITGSAMFRGNDLLTLRGSELRKIRGREISIIYQEPALALNPVMRIGDQVAEVLRAHTSHNSSECGKRARQMLESVRLSATRFYGAYPHELSGGERHRVVLAQALACRPALVIADEPTSGLDAALKSEILDLIDNLRTEFEAAFLLISHDRNVIDRLADRTIDLSNGNKQAFNLSVQSWKPSVEDMRERAPLISVRNLSKWYRPRGLFNGRRTEKHALDAVDLNIPHGSLVALVGPSGSGKSTLARCLALLEEADAGEIQFQQKNLLDLTAHERREYRPLLQYVAQDPAAALNPRLSAGETIEEPLLIQGQGSSETRRKRAEELMQQVGLDPATAKRSCHEFSGGQKQRLAIARALALEPKLLIFDESLSGLDPETQAGIVSLILSLKHTLGIAQLLVSHDLDLVAAVADSVAVMQNGRIVEHASATKIVGDPEHWSVEHVLHAAPRQELVLAEAE